MDFDGDGIPDVLSGSFDGPIFLFKGDGKGAYLAPTKLTTGDGKELVLDEATSVSAYDWDKDGKPDLVVGTIQGPVWYVRNLGKGVVAAPVKLGADGTDLDALDGGPCAVDWDGDGVMDLFLGADTGKLMYFKGKKSSEKPDFEAGVEILPALTEREFEPRPPLDSEPLDWALKRPGMRAKPTVTDWNGDGKLDLLVGDMHILENRNDKLTPDQKQTYDRLKKKQTELRAKAEVHYADLKKKVLEKLGWSADRKLTPEEGGRYSDEFGKFYAEDKEVIALDEELSKIFDEIRPLSPSTDYHGFVWLFLHK